jgi:aminoglycoside/choline kinase family phosphotransferase
MPSTRLQELKQWLGSLPEGLKLNLSTLEPASNDASFRRYFRILTNHDDFPSLIIMDAPVDKEDVNPFINVAQVLAKAGLNVPQVLHINQKDGFLLLSDLGNTTYLSALNQSTANHLYQEANKSLVCMQTKADVSKLPIYDEALLQKEMDLFL